MRLTKLRFIRAGVSRQAPARFCKDESGAHAVEFALVGMPFLFMISAIVEIAMAFWSTQVLETAVANAARELYTGQFQQDGANQNQSAADLRTKMKGKVCGYVTALFNCTAKVSVDIQTFSNYGEANALKSPMDANRNYDTSSYGYKSPAANQISVVRASMEYPVFVPMLSPSAKLASGNRLIVATSTFRTEPYTN